MPLEHTACPLCGSFTSARLMETRDRLCGVPGTFALVRCRQCGLTYLTPRPDAAGISAYYPPAYDPHQIIRLEDLGWLKRATVAYGLRKRTAAILRHKARGKILDVGCATGLFLAEMQKLEGWQAFGVEPSAEAAAVAEAVHHLPVHVGDLASAGFTDATFDAVTLWDVLEHLHDPVGVLCDVRRVLKPDGILVMRTPSLASWDATIFGRYWAGLDSPRHLAIFTPSTLAELMRRAGFSLESVRTGTGSYVIVLLSLRFWLAEHVKRERWRRVVLGIFDNPLAKAIALLPFAITDRLGYGSAMTVVARPATDGLGVESET